ncbi:MAG: TraM recognition domain-containing protein, partial [Fervidobacterium sp.]
PVIEFWKKQAERITYGEFTLENMTTWITSKLNPFITNDFVRPIIAQAKSVLNFREIMDTRKILIINLAKGKIGETSAYLMGMLLITKILLAAFSRIDIPEEERKDFYLYVDEFQNFAFKGVASILSEARKYKLTMILAHQYIKQLPEEISSAVFGNVGTIISFRVGVEDAEVLERQFAPVFSKLDLVNIPNYHAYI